MLMHTTLNFFQNLMFILIKLFFLHIRSRIPLTFDLNLNRNSSKLCISQYCSQLPQHSHYDETDLNPFFYRTLSKPIPQWFLAVETTMLQFYSIVHENTLKKINSHACIKKTPITKVDHFPLALLFLNEISLTFIVLTN